MVSDWVYHEPGSETRLFGNGESAAVSLVPVAVSQANASWIVGRSKCFVQGARVSLIGGVQQ